MFSLPLFCRGDAELLFCAQASRQQGIQEGKIDSDAQVSFFFDTFVYVCVCGGCVCVCVCVCVCLCCVCVGVCWWCVCVCVCVCVYRCGVCVYCGGVYD